ncbi:MAG: GyrI-like domain-containing protein [Phycisphaerales bacterium]|nr:GyrI-like domain-containing protein [Phycisphaerales bacterium]
MRTSRKTRGTTRAAYVERVNLAIDHMVTHLAEPLSLSKVARVAMFSPYHFHRVFQALVGETPADFVKRLRLDRALFMMAHGRRASLTRIALACGFASSSDFSRSFKQRFGVAPSAFDMAAWREAHRAELEERVLASADRLHLRKLPARANPDGFKVKIRDLPARTVAYIRVSDPYKPNAVTGAADRLMAWADERNLSDGQWLGYQWENPELVPLEQCRYHVAVEATRFTAAGEVGRFRFPAMNVAQVEIRGPIDLELRALQWLYSQWLPRSSYEPANHPAFEAWIGKPFAHGLEHFELSAQLPIRSA